MAKARAQTPKGFRDFLPEEARLRESVIATLKEVFASYGFSPLETPAIEYKETLLGKYGEEADKLIYLFMDRGGRDVGLRYDLTVPLARVVAQHQNELHLPFRRYQIGPQWRAEKPQAGRYREFWQADIDIVGSASLLADAEVLACTLEAVARLGFTDSKLLINDRKLLDSLGITPKLAIIVDKKEKIGLKQIEIELSQKAGKAEVKQILRKLKGAEEPESIKNIRNYVRHLGGDPKRLVFNPWLARGLEYYTGPIFELKVGGGNLSVGGGGRYDKLVGKFAGRELPATGFSFGIDRVVEALKETGSLIEGEKVASPEVLVAVFGEKLAPASLKVASTLRSAGFSVEVYPDEKAKLDKQLKYADKRGVSWVVIIGPEEAKKKRVTLRDMESGEQETLSLSELKKKLGGN